MSRKRGKQRKPAVEAIPDDILAEGSGPVGRASKSAVTTVEDVVTTDDIATTEDVVTADDVVATASGPEVLAADDGAPEVQELVGDDAVQLGHTLDEPSVGETITETIAETIDGARNAVAGISARILSNSGSMPRSTQAGGAASWCAGRKSFGLNSSMNGHV